LVRWSAERGAEKSIVFSLSLAQAFASVGPIDERQPLEFVMIRYAVPAGREGGYHDRRSCQEYGRARVVTFRFGGCFHLPRSLAGQSREAMGGRLDARSNPTAGGRATGCGLGPVDRRHRHGAGVLDAVGGTWPRYYHGGSYLPGALAKRVRH